MKRTALKRKAPMPCPRGSLARTAPITAVAVSLVQRTRLRPVSTKRAAENRVRRKVVTEMVNVDPLCRYPQCTRFAVDAHEKKFRSRLGSITDRNNIVILCRDHHEFLHANPEKAHAFGWAVHSWE